MDDLTKDMIQAFIEGKRDWVTVTREDFDGAMALINGHSIETYQYEDAGEVVIEKITKAKELTKMAIDTTSTKVITSKVRLSYTHIFEPQSMDGGEPKFSTAILIPKSDTATINKIKAAIKAAAEQGKALWGGKIPPNLKTPLRDGDEERPDDEAYAGHMFLNASSKNQPGIAKPIGKGPDGKTKFQDITDSTEVYSGCYAKVSINLYAFNKNGNRGVAAGLNNIVKIQDGEALAGRASVNADFADEDFEDVYEDGEDEDFLS